MSRRRRYFDHVDLRVQCLSEVRPFYEIFLPALGFSRNVTIEGWLQYEGLNAYGPSEFFGITESPQHVANECRIAFWADSINEVDRLTEIAVQAGALNIEGPAHEIPQPGQTIYYASFFDDPGGNRLEICFRTMDRVTDAAKAPER